MAERQRMDETASINQQLAALEERVNNANYETRTYSEKRDRLNQQLRKIREEIHVLEDERNRLNEVVKTLKQQREAIRTIITANIQEIEICRQKLADLKKKKPKQSHQELQKEFTDIEWKIQTTTLDLQEEKRLIENVKQLEPRLNVYKKIEQNILKIAELKKELDMLETRKDLFHKELEDTAHKSQEIHAAMLAKISESRNIKTEADTMHNAYLQAKEKAKPLIEEIKKMVEQRAKLRGAIREEDERKKKTAEYILRQKLGTQAKEKLQRGEELSWDEFQLLGENDSET